MNRVSPALSINQRRAETFFESATAAGGLFSAGRGIS